MRTGKLGRRRIGPGVRWEKALSVWISRLRSHRQALIWGAVVGTVVAVVWWYYTPKPGQAYRAFARAFQQKDYAAVYQTFSPGDRRFLTPEAHRRMVTAWQSYLPQRIERWRLVEVERDPEPTVVDFLVEVEVRLSQQSQTVKRTLAIPVRRHKEYGRWVPWHVNARAFYGSYFSTFYGYRGVKFFNQQYRYYAPAVR